MRKFVKKMIAAGITALLLTAGMPHSYALAPIMPAQELREGMSGQAYTVVDSAGELRSFDVDIVGLLGVGKGSNNMIMAKAKGPLIHQVGGILQGMSGSPVYVNGRLVGAVAAGLKEMTPYTFFITPIENMLPLWQMPDNKNKTRIRSFNLHKYLEDKKKAEAGAAKKDKKGQKAGNSQEVDLDAELAKIKDKEIASKAEKPAKDKAGQAENKDGDKASQAEEKEKAGQSARAKAEEKADQPAAQEAKPAARTEKKATVKAEPKDVLYLSGFTPAGIQFLREKMPLGQQYNLLPLGNDGLNGVAETDYHASLRPGDPVGVAIAYGDFAVGATGTITATDGRKILAFGHPFLHKGNVNYFMTKASVVGTISGVSNGMKLANLGAIIGRISQDRGTGIAGTLGEFPAVVPVRVKVVDHDLGRTEQYGARVAYDEDYLSQIVGGIAYGAMSKTCDSLGGSTADVHFTVRTNAVPEGKLERSNMFYNTADVGQIAVAEIMQAMNIICDNTEKESDIIDLQVDVTVDSERKTATLLSAVPDKTKVKPGDTVKFTVTLKPYRRDKETLLINYTVPETQREGMLNLDVRGGGLVPVTNLMLLQQSGVDVAAPDDKKKTTADKLKEFQQTGRNNEIIIAPGPAPEMTPKQKREAVRAAKRAAAENLAKAKAQSRKVNLLGVNTKKPQNGETKFTTKYIIDNVLHTTLQVVRK